MNQALGESIAKSLVICDVTRRVSRKEAEQPLLYGFGAVASMHKSPTYTCPSGPSLGVCANGSHGGGGGAPFAFDMQKWAVIG